MDPSLKSRFLCWANTSRLAPSTAALCTTSLSTDWTSTCTSGKTVGFNFNIYCILKFIIISSSFRRSQFGWMDDRNGGRIRPGKDKFQCILNLICGQLCFVEFLCTVFFISLCTYADLKRAWKNAHRKALNCKTNSILRQTVKNKPTRKTQKLNKKNMV